MKKADFLVIIIILLISGLVAFITGKNEFVDNKLGKKVIITVNGNVYKEIVLNEKTNEKIKIDNEFGHNVVVVKDQKVYIEESDCKDKICMKKGKISLVGDSIICLPNRLLIKIVSDKEKGLDVILRWQIENLFFYLF